MAVYKSENKTKDGRQWYYRVRKKDINGNTKEITSKMFMTKSDALEEERLFLLKRDNPLHKNFDLVAKDYFNNISTIKKDDTILSYTYDYNKHIKPYFENKNIDEIKMKDIINWHEIMENLNYSTSYLNKINNCLKSIFEFAVVYYGLPINYAKQCGSFKTKKDKVIKDEDKIRYITHEDFNKFIETIDNDLYYAYFNFLYYTGVRKGESFALLWSDIDFNTREIKINKTLTDKISGGGINITSTKNNQNRTIKMNNTLYEIMLEFYNKRKKYNEFSDSWYVFGDLIPIKRTSVDRYKHKYFELSGVKEITLHEFRHSHVSLLINEYVKTSKEKNMKVDTAKFFLMMSNRMGHTIEVMQRTYLHLFPSIQDEIVDLLDNL